VSEKLGKREAPMYRTFDKYRCSKQDISHDLDADRIQTSRFDSMIPCPNMSLNSGSLNSTSLKDFLQAIRGRSKSGAGWKEYADKGYAPVGWRNRKLHGLWKKQYFTMMLKNITLRMVH